jgi:hypothetical protein
MIVFVSEDGRWRVECTAAAMRIFEKGPRSGLVLRYRCHTPDQLDAWLREHADLQLADLRED